MYRYFSIAISTCLSKMRNYGDYGHTCNPHDDYVHVTGNTLPHRDSLHFLWGKYLQCSYLHLGWILQFSVSSHTPQFFFVFPFILILPLSWLFLSSVFVEHQGLYAVTWLQVPSMSFYPDLSRFCPKFIQVLSKYEEAVFLKSYG